MGGRQKNFEDQMLYELKDKVHIFETIHFFWTTLYMPSKHSHCISVSFYISLKLFAEPDSMSLYWVVSGPFDSCAYYYGPIIICLPPRQCRQIVVK